MSYVAIAIALLSVIVALRVFVPMTIRIATKVSVRDLRRFSEAFEQRLVEYMRSSYSGDPAQLEGAIRGLLAIAREMARQEPEPLGDDLLQTLIVTAIAAHRFARRGQAQSALDAVLRAERSAA
jgi:hypothetical protein